VEEFEISCDRIALLSPQDKDVDEVKFHQVDGNSNREKRKEHVRFLVDRVKSVQAQLPSVFKIKISCCCLQQNQQTSMWIMIASCCSSDYGVRNSLLQS